MFWQGTLKSYSVHASFKKKVMTFLGCAGGKISLDKEGNAAIYGASTDAASILAAPSSNHNPPDALKPLYDELNQIAAEADGGGPQKMERLQEALAPRHQRCQAKARVTHQWNCGLTATEQACSY